MNLRTSLAAAFVLLLALSALPGHLFGGPPNVVMIISDDQGWTDFGFMGHETVRTPHLDKLAGQSLTFTRGYVPTSLCRASLATLATGLYPHQHRITSNDPPQRNDRSGMLKHIQSSPTLPRMLGQQGYRSLQTGKWWEGNYKLGGFTHGMTHGDPARRGRHGDEGLAIGRQGLEPVFSFIREAGERPFFVWYAPMMPHTPHTPPERLLSKYATTDRSPHVAKYYAMCEWFDETCGQLLGFLDEQKLSDNTLVVFVTDNGWIQDPNSGKYAPKSKRSPYDGGLRTPIMVRWPGKISPRRDEQTLVSSLDLAPTILAACGLKATADMPGVNLLEVAKGNKLERSRLFGEIFTHDAADIDRPAANLLYRWCVDDSWKLILPHAAGEKPELYNLAADPHETKDLAAAQPQQVERLRGLIDQWWTPEAAAKP